MATCSQCKGSGQGPMFQDFWGWHNTSCERCKGTGEVQVSDTEWCALCPDWRYCSPDGGIAIGSDGYIRFAEYPEYAQVSE